MDLVVLGKFIAELRKEQKLTQSQLGELLNVSDKTVSKWERGVNAPDISLLNEMSKIFNITTTELLNCKRIQRADGKIELDTFDQITRKGISFYNKVEKGKKNKLKIIVICSFLIIFLLLVIIVINNFNQCFIYSLSSDNSDFILSGTMIFNQEKNKIIIDQITYNDIYVGTDKELMITDLNLYLKLNDKVIFSENVNVNDLSFSNVINNIRINLEEPINYKEYIIDRNNISHLSLVFEYHDLNGDLNQIETKLICTEDFVNNKIFY